jgi:hypothetical protein
MGGGVVQTEAVHGLHKFGERRWHRFERIDRRRPRGKHLCQLGRHEPDIRPDIKYHGPVFIMQPGDTQCQFAFVSSAMIEWMFTKIPT